MPDVIVQPAAQVSINVSVGQGPAGPPGEAFEGTGDLNYVHTQSAASAVWTINHGLGKYPSVVAIDSAGTQWEGEVTYLNDDSLTIEFSVPFGGTAYLN